MWSISYCYYLHLVIMNEQGQSNIDDDNEEVVQEIYETDINIEHSDSESCQFV